MSQSGRWLSALCLAWVCSGCDAGPQTLGWETEGALAPLPWYGGPEYYERFSHGFPAAPSFFPIGIWLQQPSNATRFGRLGINHHVGLWMGPTEAQLAAAEAAAMPAVCEQAGVWQQHLESAVIKGWLHTESPDNAQEYRDGSFGPCVEPTEVQARYAAMLAADATRPVMLVLGQGVASPNYVGRGSCSGRSDHYPAYAAAADILVNYTYPLMNGHPLELLGVGIDNLNGYAGFSKPVVASVEASTKDAMLAPTPHQLRAEVWMSLIHGAAGILYYCHRFEAGVLISETACLENPEIAAEMTRLNAQLSSLAPVLNTQSYSMKPVSSDVRVPLAAIAKKHGDERYVFAVSLANAPTTAHFSLRDLGEPTRIEVLGEGRNLVPSAGGFDDAFEPYAVHLYQLR